MKALSALVALALCTSASVAAAQGVARTFDELRLLVRSGDTLTVTDETGQEVTGKLDTLSSASLAMEVDRRAREWRESDVRRISQRHSDSVANGALIGLAVGGGVAALGIAVSAGRHYDASAGEVALAIGLYAGMGAGIGAGVDALIPARRVVFERPISSTASIRVAPMLGPRRAGAGLSLVF